MLTKIAGAKGNRNEELPIQGMRTRLLQFFFHPEGVHKMKFIYGKKCYL